MNNTIDFEALKAPFAEKDIEWRVSRSGIRDGKPWAKVLAYVTNRAIQDRLDSVCGPENWKNKYRRAPEGGILCGIGIRINSEWVFKWDGAENTDIEPVKGGLSGSMKRTAVHWGIGRYLYNLEEGWAEFTQDGTHSDRIKANKQDGGTFYRWNPPELPIWALPDGTEKPMKKMATPPAGRASKSSSQSGEKLIDSVIRRIDESNLPPEKKERFKKDALGKSTDEILATWVKGFLEYQLSGAAA